MTRLIIFIMVLPILAFAQTEKVHIGNGVDKLDAILQIDSNTKGILMPRMTSANRNAIVSPAEGLMIYDTDSQGFWLFNGSDWCELLSRNISRNIFGQTNAMNFRVETGNSDDDKVTFRISQDMLVLSNESFHLAEDIIFKMKSGSSEDVGIDYEDVSNENSLRVGQFNPLAVKGDNSVSISNFSMVPGANGFSAGSGLSAVIGDEGTVFGIDNSANGDRSFAMGSGNTADGHNSTAWGTNCLAEEEASVAWGKNAQAYGVISVAWGEGAQANSETSTAFGKGIANGVNSTAWGSGETTLNNSFSWGSSTKSYSENETALGTTSAVYTPTGTSTDKLFTIGLDDPVAGPYNVFEVRKDNSTRYTGEFNLVIEGFDFATLGLKEETNGSLFGFEFEYDGLSQKLNLISKGFANNEDTRMIIQTSGFVGIGLESIQNALGINGEASKSVAGPWLANSDERLKKNIQKMNSQEMLEKVLQMQGVSYEWNDDKTQFTRPEGIQYGFIAQDLEEIWPEKITKDELGFLQTAYGDYDSFFVGAFRSQQSTIENLQSENENFKSAGLTLNEENKKLLAELAQMEQVVSAVRRKLED